MKLEFANGQSVEIANTAVNATAQELFSEIGLPATAASENPFERVPIRKITGNDPASLAKSASSAHPGSECSAVPSIGPVKRLRRFVTYKPFRGAEGILPVEIDLPRDLSQGTYQLIISDAQRYFQDMQQAEPFRFTADNIKDVFGVLKDVAAIRQNAVYLRLLRQPDGVAVGRVALPELPSSRRQILLGAGRSNITPFVSSKVKVVPTEMVMYGSAEFAITIDPTAKVELADPKPGQSRAGRGAACPPPNRETTAKPQANRPAGPSPTEAKPE